MGFLAGALSPLLTAATQAVGGVQEGKLQAIAEKLRQDHQAKQEALAQALGGANIAHQNAETNALLHPPKAKPVYDADRGVTVDTEQGVATPVAGITAKPHAPIEGSPEDLAATKAKAIINAKASNEFGYHTPPSQFSFGTAVGEDGKPVVLRQNTKTGEVTPTNVAKPAAGGNAQGQQQMAAAKANMESAMKVMDDYEAKLRKDPSLFSTLAATEGALAASPTGITAQHSWDIPVSLAANAAASHLQKSNPELAKYLTAKKFMAEAILNTHKRPNQTQYEIEQEIGGVGANPSGMQIDLVASRRRRMYDELFGGASHAPGTPPSGASNKPKLSQAGYQNGRSKGMTDAQLEEHYDLSGVTRQ